MGHESTSIGVWTTATTSACGGADPAWLWLMHDPALAAVVVVDVGRVDVERAVHGVHARRGVVGLEQRALDALRVGRGKQRADLRPRL
jgi:hypothetical protein